MSDNRMSIEDQRRLGYLPECRQPFVAPDIARPAKLEIMPGYETHLDVTHPTTQHVELRTSATDRARGFQMMITPISLVVAVLAVIVSLAFESELFSFSSLLIFWLTFAVIYVAGWLLTALATPEAVSFYSARRQWDVIEREQAERWAHYRWQSGRQLADRQNAAETPTARRGRNDVLERIAGAWWAPWAAGALVVYVVVCLAWLILTGGL